MVNKSSHPRRVVLVDQVAFNPVAPVPHVHVVHAHRVRAQVHVRNPARVSLVLQRLVQRSPHLAVVHQVDPYPPRTPADCQVRAYSERALSPAQVLGQHAHRPPRYNHPHVHAAIRQTTVHSICTGHRACVQGYLARHVQRRHQVRDNQGGLWVHSPEHVENPVMEGHHRIPGSIEPLDILRRGVVGVPQRLEAPVLPSEIVPLRHVVELLQVVLRGAAAMPAAHVLLRSHDSKRDPEVGNHLHHVLRGHHVLLPTSIRVLAQHKRDAQPLRGGSPRVEHGIDPLHVIILGNNHVADGLPPVQPRRQPHCLLVHAKHGHKVPVPVEQRRRVGHPRAGPRVLPRTVRSDPTLRHWQVQYAHGPVMVLHPPPSRRDGKHAEKKDPPLHSLP
mmetsp:Transcript_27111/g.68314  ORF Transcript_27111/g.68314 Transcript_27111/m.68314 type:complete len:389 (+) Transcript_27111:92-1258(+)